MNFRNGALPRKINSPEYYKNKQFMFIDISGFTPLCDKFIRESSYGAEKIGDLVNTVFNPIIDFVFEKGGDVISFAGDALFVAVEKKSVKAVQDMAQKLIKEQTIDKSLAITIDMLEDKYYPNIITTKIGSSFSYFPNFGKKSKLEKTFPDEIYDIYKSNFRGELRAVPIFFIHISEKYSIKDIIRLLEFLTLKAKESSVYINKIEYLDKGWMILLSAGSPIYSSEAPVKMYDMLSKFSKKAKAMSIPVQIGGTLQRGYCGIIGNEKRWEFTFLGSNVNLAARIAFSSEDYKISCDQSFAHSADSMLRSKSIGIKNYKGVGDREVFEVTGKIKDKKNIFVGREKEITNALNLFSGSRRAFMLINGPSGIGKTVLAEQIISSLGIENVIRLKGTYGDDQPNYVFKQMEGCSKMNSAELFRKFRSISTPTLIYIDDLHFSDEESLFLLHRMINEGNQMVGLLATTIGKEKIMITPFSYYETSILDLKPFEAKDIQSITKLYSGI
ncbi:MAG: AAA family ATPase, partial [Candidatus Delongbacteria bacterium]|nr:AAA family ATPase [Candidatus Delongbacteria bacterium]